MTEIGTLTCAVPTTAWDCWARVMAAIAEAVSRSEASIPASWAIRAESDSVEDPEAK